MTLRVAAAMLCLLMSGCATQAPEAPAVLADDDHAEAPKEAKEADDPEVESQPAAEQYGLIRGIVVNGTQAPIEGVHVAVLGGNETTTNATGTFELRNVDPGEHVLEAAKQGYLETRTLVRVDAGEHDPDVVWIHMDMLGPTQFIVEDHFEGSITCSINIPGAGFSDGCGLWSDAALGTTQRHAVVFGPGPIQWIQHELVWESNGMMSDNLCGKIYDVETTPGGSATDTVCGTSPVVRSMNQTQLEAGRLHEDAPLSFAIYPGHLLLDVSGGIVLDQDFEVYSHAFHHFTPPPGWQFGRDGLPVAPS